MYSKCHDSDVDAGHNIETGGSTRLQRPDQGAAERYETPAVQTGHLGGVSANPANRKSSTVAVVHRLSLGIFAVVSSLSAGILACLTLLRCQLSICYTS